MTDNYLTMEYCQEYADKHGFKLSKFAEKIIARTNANGGYCPCVSEKEREEHPENNYECPCSLCIRDVKEFNHCHCSLYIKSED